MLKLCSLRSSYVVGSSAFISGRWCSFTWEDCLHEFKWLATGHHDIVLRPLFVWLRVTRTLVCGFAGLYRVTSKERLRRWMCTAHLCVLCSAVAYCALGDVTGSWRIHGWKTLGDCELATATACCRKHLWWQTSCQPRSAVQKCSLLSHPTEDANTVPLCGCDWAHLAFYVWIACPWTIKL